MIGRVMFAAAFLVIFQQMGRMEAQPLWSEVEPGSVVIAGADAQSVWNAFATLEPEERRARFEAASPALKSGLWRVHLRAFLAEHPDLTVEQLAVVREAIELASPGLFVKPLETDDGEALAKLDELSTRAKAVFPLDLGAAAFGRLGPPRRGQRSVRSLSGDGEEPPFDDGNPPTMGGCECNVWDDWCGLMYKCVGGGCYWRSWGCGTMWTKSCTGLCVFYDNCTCP